MSVLVLGVSHHSAPITLLDEVALAATTAEAMLTELAATSSVTEAMVLATCNRLRSTPQSHASTQPSRRSPQRWPRTAGWTRSDCAHTCSCTMPSARRTTCS